MRSKSGKYDFTPLEEIPPGRFVQVRGGFLKGFTLVEILVAVAIIVTIFSMVYGSYFATAKSTNIYKTRMTLSGQARKVLGQLARQIRCSYISKNEELANAADTISQGKREITEKPIMYFNYESAARTGKILHLVTTNRLFCPEIQADGLFDVIYKFDKNSGTLYLSQKRFVGKLERIIEKRNWRPLLTGIKSIELDFFDGRQWLPEWDFEQKKKLPVAVKISINCEDENYRQCHYGTVAYVVCSGNKGQKTSSEKIVSVAKQ